MGDLLGRFTEEVIRFITYNSLLVNDYHFFSRIIIGGF